MASKYRSQLRSMFARRVGIKIFLTSESTSKLSAMASFPRRPLELDTTTDSDDEFQVPPVRGPNTANNSGAPNAKRLSNTVPESDQDFANNVELHDQVKTESENGSSTESGDGDSYSYSGTEDASTDTADMDYYDIQRYLMANGRSITSVLADIHSVLLDISTALKARSQP